jgi:hypothetical protein
MTALILAAIAAEVVCLIIATAGWASSNISSLAQKPEH